MAELWLKNNQLIPKREWEELIDSLRSRETVADKEKAKKLLREKLISAVKGRIPAKRFGILFSGGVDSSFIAAICQKEGADFICYTAGFQDEETKEPEDITEAKKVARKLGFKWKPKIYNLAEARKIMEKTVKILKTADKTDAVNVGVGAVVLAAIELAKNDGIDYFFSGLGSEEIFAGYERHSRAENVQEECWNGLKGMWDRDLVRDFTLARTLGVTIRTPFLDEELVRFAMKLPAEWKISREEKKLIFREVAEEFLGTFAWRRKKAAQYGSCFDKAMGKLARKEGFKLKREWVESLAAVNR